jgi:hypothetical protein
MESPDINNGSTPIGLGGKARTKFGLAACFALPPFFFAMMWLGGAAGAAWFALPPFFAMMWLGGAAGAAWTPVLGMLSYISVRGAWFAAISLGFSLFFLVAGLRKSYLGRTSS